MRKILLSLLCISLITGCSASTCTSRIDYYNIETDGYFTPEKVDEGLYRINYKMHDYYINLGTNEFFNDEFLFNWSNHTFIQYNFAFHFGYDSDKEPEELNMFLDANTPFFCQFNAADSKEICDSYNQDDDETRHMQYEAAYQRSIITLLYFLLKTEAFDEYGNIFLKPTSELLADLDEITKTFPLIENPVSSIPYLQIRKRQ